MSFVGKTFLLDKPHHILLSTYSLSTQQFAQYGNSFPKGSTLTVFKHCYFSSVVEARVPEGQSCPPEYNIGGITWNLITSHVLGPRPAT